MSSKERLLTLASYYISMVLSDFVQCLSFAEVFIDRRIHKPEGAMANFSGMSTVRSELDRIAYVYILIVRPTGLW